MKKKETPPFESYLISETYMIIFALLYLDGDVRATLLGIHEELYESKKKAKNWQSKIIKKVHPDHCNHPRASDATAKLNEIYRRMTSHGE